KKPSVNCFMDMQLETLEEARKEAIERGSDTLYLAIVLKENNKVIGEIFAHAESTDPADSVKDTFSPCWMLNEDYQGKGYMYEAAKAYFDLLFNQEGARRIYIYTEDYNIACQKLSEKLGMRQEGLFKEFVSFVNGPDGKPIYENTYQYAILKKEWENR
ncbi:MAG: GNAT family protein, partial [bacterium]|nr:GNAT family protein [bacterium]